MKRGKTANGSPLMGCRRARKKNAAERIQNPVHRTLRSMIFFSLGLHKTQCLRTTPTKDLVELKNRITDAHQLDYSRDAPTGL